MVIGDARAELYDKTISELLDHQVPVQLITCRRRPMSTWFEDDCRKAKRALCASEKAAHRAGPLSNIDLPAVRAWHIQRRQYFELLRKKRSTFWSTRVDAEQSQPSRLWRPFDKLLGRGHVPPSTDISTSDLHSFFDNKVVGVRAATADADPPSFTPAPVGCVLRLFSAVTPADVVHASVKALPDKQCASDPLPPWLLKKYVGVISPFLCQLFNWSLEHGSVPSSFKCAHSTPLLKKADLDPADVKSYTGRSRTCLSFPSCLSDLLARSL